MNAPSDPSDRYPDEELLARIRRGEYDLFGPLVRRYERELYGYLRRYTGDADLAADVFQNTCVAVFTKIKQYEPGRPARPSAGGRTAARTPPGRRPADRSHR